MTGARGPAVGRHKYGAIKTVYSGEVYPSKAEAAYAERLDRLKMAGAIQEWTRLSAKGAVVLQAQPRITYRPDFLVVGRDLRVHLVEVKGMETPVWKLKKRLYAAVGTYPLLIVYRDRQEWLYPASYSAPRTLTEETQ